MAIVNTAAANHRTWQFHASTKIHRKNKGNRNGELQADYRKQKPQGETSQK